MVNVVVDMLPARQLGSGEVLLKKYDVQNIETMFSMCLDALAEALVKTAQAAVHILYLSYWRFAGNSSCGQGSTTVEDQENYAGNSTVSSVIVPHKALVSFDNENIIIFTAQYSCSLAYWSSTTASVKKLVLQSPNGYIVGGKSNMEAEQQCSQHRLFLWFMMIQLRSVNCWTLLLL